MWRKCHGIAEVMNLEAVIRGKLTMGLPKLVLFRQM